MFYKMVLKDHIRVAPKDFDKDKKEAVLSTLKEKYSGLIKKDLGYVIDVADIQDIKEGIIIAGDGAVYYNTVFEIITYKPEMQEVVAGVIRDITDFGAFINVGPTDGMIHISQTMDDFVSFSKEKVLLGKESKQTLKVGDRGFARVIAISFKDLTNPKIGLTMRQSGLGRPEWLDDKQKKAAK